jgi:hypothetical protein
MDNPVLIAISFPTDQGNIFPGYSELRKHCDVTRQV